MWTKIFNAVTRFQTKIEILTLEAELNAAKGGYCIATGAHGGALMKIDAKAAQAIIKRTEKDIAALNLKL